MIDSNLIEARARAFQNGLDEAARFLKLTGDTLKRRNLTHSNDVPALLTDVADQVRKLGDGV